MNNCYEIDGTCQEGEISLSVCPMHCMHAQSVGVRRENELRFEKVRYICLLLLHVLLLLLYSLSKHIIPLFNG